MSVAKVHPGALPIPPHGGFPPYQLVTSVVMCVEIRLRAIMSKPSHRTCTTGGKSYASCDSSVSECKE